jgi:hypothetical protein
MSQDIGYPKKWKPNTQDDQTSGAWQKKIVVPCCAITEGHLVGWVSGASGGQNLRDLPYRRIDLWKKIHVSTISTISSKSQLGNKALKKIKKHIPFTRC